MSSLQGAPAALELPTDHPRPAVADFHGAVLPFDLPKIYRWRQWSWHSGKASRCTCCCCLCSRYCCRAGGQQDILVGTPVAGRTYRATENLIGFFINTLVLRSEIKGAQSVRELLACVKNTTLNAYAHQDLPFEKLVAELQPQRDLSRQPIYQVDFTFQNVPRERLVLPGLTFSGIGVEYSSSKLDLSLHLSDAPAGLHGAFEYATNLFDLQTIQRMVEQYEFLLEQVVAESGQSG